MTFASWPTYDSYKDSGVEWIGEVPSTWNVERGKWLFVKKDRPVRPDDKIVTCFRDGQVTLRNNRRTEGFTNALKEHGYQGIRKGDLVIHAMDAFAGAIGVSDSDGKATPVYSACVPREPDTVDPYFYAYYMRHIALSGLLVSLSKGIRERSTDFRYNDFADLQLAAPSLLEQRAIAAFLDEKCAKIDDAVRIKEAQIALLRERRQILIQEAVTRGLNPDAPMKDSGIDWIGQIPAHWEVKKLKYAADIFRGKFTHRPRNDPRLYDGVYPFFQTGDVARAGMFLSEFKQTLNEKGLRVSTLIPKGTILITIAANIGDVAILGVDACFPDSVVGFKPKTIVERDFLYYSMSSMKRIFLESSIANAQANLNVDRIGAIAFCIPPRNEQATIINYVAVADRKISDAITIKQNQITTLKEYKTCLINAAVTGKIKVT